MKLKYFALAMACVMALALTGCSANRDADNTASLQPTDNVSAGQNDRPGADVGGGAVNSPDVNGAQNGAGANDKDHNGSGVGNAIDDIGDAAGDAVQGAGDAIGDAGRAIGNAANGAGRTMP